MSEIIILRTVLAMLILSVNINLFLKFVQKIQRFDINHDGKNDIIVHYTCKVNKWQVRSTFDQEGNLWMFRDLPKSILMIVFCCSQMGPMDVLD